MSVDEERMHRLERVLQARVDEFVRFESELTSEELLSVLERMKKPILELMRPTRGLRLVSPDVGRSQRSALREARGEAEETGDTVHVFGEPVDANGDARALDAGERLCTSLDAGELVIFHPKSSFVGTSKDCLCPECGVTSGEAV